jgi:hypothetical protein
MGYSPEPGLRRPALWLCALAGAFHIVTIAALALARPQYLPMEAPPPPASPTQVRWPHTVSVCARVRDSIANARVRSLVCVEVPVQVCCPHNRCVGVCPVFVRCVCTCARRVFACSGWVRRCFSVARRVRVETREARTRARAYCLALTALLC